MFTMSKVISLILHIVFMILAVLSYTRNNTQEACYYLLWSLIFEVSSI